MANKYSRANAVKYATAYALAPNPNYKYFPLINDQSGDCTNFLSQCLLAGGATMNYISPQEWWYKHNSSQGTTYDTCSITWSVTHSFYWLLKTNQEKKIAGVKGIEITDIRKLELGDLIFYEKSNGAIFHGAIITRFNGIIPLICQHSYEALNIPYTSTWKAKRIHFLKINI